MSFSDDGWGSDGDDVKAAEPKADNTSEIILTEIPIVEEKPKIAPIADVIEQPVDMIDDEVDLDFHSEDGWGKDTPVKKIETRAPADLKVFRAFVLPPPAKTVQEVVDDNVTYDETLDFAQPEEMTSPCPTNERKFLLPPKVERSDAVSRKEEETDPELIKMLVGPPSLKPTGFEGNAKPAGFGGKAKPAGFGGDPNSAGLGEDSKQTKPTFGKQLSETTNSPLGGNTADSAHQAGFGEANESERRQVKFSEISELKKPNDFGENRSFGKLPDKVSKTPIGFGKQDENKNQPMPDPSVNSSQVGSFVTASSGFSSTAQKHSGFGGVTTSTKPSGFGAEVKPSNGWGASESKPSGFGKSEEKPSGFGTEEKSKEWGRSASKPFGSGNSEERTSGFGENISSKPHGFGAASSESKPSGFGRPFGVADEFVSTKPSGFGKSDKPSGFGEGEKSSFGWSGSESKSSGFGKSEQKPSGFGSREKSTSGWGSSEAKSFGQSGAKSGFGGGKETNGFGGSSKTSGFGSGGKSGEFGDVEVKSSGFGSSSVSSKISGFSNENKSDSWGQTGSKLSGFGSSQKSNGWGQDESKKSDFGVASGFGVKSSGGFGDNKPSEFGDNKSSGFGEKKPSGFGDNKSSGFGGNKSSGFGDNKSSGFGEKKPSGFGDNKSSGFGDNKSSGFGPGSGGFGKPVEGGFGGRSGSGFGSGGDTGFGSTPKSFGENNGGFGGGDRKRGCFNCGNEDHRKDECPEPPKALICHNCREEGHASRDCLHPRVPHGACRNCGEEGHFSKDCEKPRVPTGPCRNCQQEGHFAKDCTNERVFVEPTEPCRRCGEEGHWAYDCPSRPKDLFGNPLVPYDVQFTSETDLFKEAVDNDERIDFDQKVFASIGNASVPDYATFDEFKTLAPELTCNLRRMKMNRPTPIQRAAFFPILTGQEVVACAHTGSGKTLAFLVPFATKLIEDMRNHDGIKDEKPSPGLLIVAPTRELASQTFNTARQLTYETGLKCGIAYGGYSRNANLQHLRSFDQLNILVATMGRLQDFLESNDISLAKLRYIVLDEADRMVDSNDFGQEVSKIIGNPNERTAQTVLFSASFSENLQREDLPKFMKEGYVMLQVDKFGTANEKIEQVILSVPRSEKRTELCKVLGLDENTCSLLPGARIETEKTLIFVNSVKFSDSLASFLCNSGVQTIPMHSYQNQEIRDRTLDEFRRGKFMCMVASNVAARGLNITGLDHVINYDMPDMNGFDEYVNRIGRTGRAGFTGAATAFVDEESDREIIPSLVNILIEAKKPVPEWLTTLNDQAGDYNEEGGEEEW